MPTFPAQHAQDRYFKRETIWSIYLSTSPFIFYLLI
jgi:hypothetical protein